MDIAVIGGAGYVGLITAVGLAKLGHNVIGTDINSARIEMLRKSISPIHEPGIEEALAETQSLGTLNFTTDTELAVKNSNVVFLAVGTPPRHDGSTDLNQLRSAVTSMAKALTPDTVLVIKSTLPAGTLNVIKGLLAEAGGTNKIDFVINPEFLSEGNGLNDFFFPSRIVVGTESSRGAKILREIFAPFTDGGSITTDILMSRNVPYIETDPVDAQLIKYASNAFLATRVSFINEVAAICEQVGADIGKVAEGLGYDPRIGHRYLQAGIGFGGPCLEKDLVALINFSGLEGHTPQLLKAVLDRNDEQIRVIIRKISGLLDNQIMGKRIGVLGLAFKPGTNDARSSLSLRVMTSLLEMGAHVVASDPMAIPDAKEIVTSARYEEDPEAVFKDADLILFLTAWPEYKDLDLAQLSKVMKKAPSIMDGVNLMSRKAIESAGFKYAGIGKPTG